MGNGKSKNIGKTIEEACKNIGKIIKEACDGVLENGSFKTLAIAAKATIKEACDGVLENVSFKTVAIAAGVALAAIAIKRVFGLFGSGSGRKTMKAPGRDGRIFRDDFESDPANYFRDLRK